MPLLLGMTCASLLWSSATNADPRVQIASELSGYTDSDHVAAVTPTIAATITDDRWSVNGRYLVDVISAASVDIVATASQRWHELRHAGSLGGGYRMDDATVDMQTQISSEPDYLSLGASGSVALRLQDDNIVPRLGLSYVHDSVGRVREPSSMFRDNETLGAQLGSTFVIDRATILGVVLDLGFQRGYLAKPYRYIPMFAPGISLPAGASIDAVNAARSPERPNEAVPDTRNRFALSARAAHRFDRVTLRADQRLYLDSWGLFASTTDARATFDVLDRLALWPRARFHAQDGASFWQRTYHAGPFLPRYRTGDRELSPLDTWTVGLGVDVGLNGALPKSEAREAGLITLSMEIDWARTTYANALYITGRGSLFGMLVVDQGW